MTPQTVALVLALGASLGGCASPPADEDEPSPVELAREIDELQAQLDALRERLQPLVEEEPATELETLTIGSVVWGDDLSLPEALRVSFGDATLLCHVEEWEGWAPMKRFTQRADRTFFLEAPGHPTVVAHMGTGGVADADGLWRETVLHLAESGRARLTPGVAYALRPRNGVDRYRWQVAEGVAVVREP